MPRIIGEGLPPRRGAIDRCGTIPPALAPTAHEPRLSPHLRALVPRRGALRARLSRQDLRRRDRGRADRRGQAQPVRAGHGDPARDGHQARAGAWLSAAGHRAAARQGPDVEVQPRPAHHRRGGARLRAGGGWPVALRDRGRVLAGPAEHADGQRDGARGVGQLPHRAARSASSTASTSSRAAWCARSTPPRSAARSTSAPWCCCRRSASRPPARRSTCRWKTWPRARRSRCRPTSCSS